MEQADFNDCDQGLPADDWDDNDLSTLFMWPSHLTEDSLYSTTDDIRMNSPQPSGVGILFAEDQQLLDFEDSFDLQSTVPVPASNSGPRIHAPPPTPFPIEDLVDKKQPTSSKAHRRSRSNIKEELFLFSNIQMCLAETCCCSLRAGGQYCLRHFDAPAVWGLRQARWNLSAKEDQLLRHNDISAGILVNSRQPRMLVQGKLICLKAYCLVYGYLRTSIMRSLAAVRKGQGCVPVGRPVLTATEKEDVVGLSPKNIQCYAWLKDWVSTVGDDDPVGKSCKKVINFVSTKELHEEYCKNYNLYSILESDRPLSERRFRAIWEHFVSKEQVRVRRKANTTTKCMECDELHTRASSSTVSRAELKLIAEERARHREDIRALRLLYMDDIQKAQSSYKFQTIVFDGTNSNTCKCPQDWRSYVRDEKGNNTFVQQKIQSVLIHGVALVFYVVTPNIELGMNLTISTLLDALQYIDPRTEVIRLQYDGLF